MAQVTCLILPPGFYQPKFDKFAFYWDIFAQSLPFYLFILIILGEGYNYTVLIILFITLLYCPCKVQIFSSVI